MVQPVVQLLQQRFITSKNVTIRTLRQQHQYVSIQNKVPRSALGEVDQNVKIEELTEVLFDHSKADGIACSADQHHQYRSVLGMISWLQSRTQFQSCYRFSRHASAAAAPTLGDYRSLNKLVRKIRAGHEGGL